MSESTIQSNPFKINVVPVLQASSKMRELAIFFKNSAHNYFPVACDHEIIGIISKDNLLREICTQYGWSLYADKTIDHFVKRTYLSAQNTIDPFELLQQALTRDYASIYEDILITSDTTYCGMVSVYNLMIYQIKASKQHLEEIDQKHRLLQQTISSNLLDQRVNPALWEKKLEAVIFTAQRLQSMNDSKTTDSSGKKNAVFHGVLGIFSVIDMMQLLIQGGKTGVLKLVQEGQEYGLNFAIYFDKGNIVHAIGGGEKGRASLWKSLRLGEGSFTFASEEQCDEITIDENPMHLLIESCRLQDEEKVL